MSDLRPVEVGGYTLLFPQWWGEIRKRDKGSLSALNSVAAESVSFDFNVMKGQGSQEQRDGLLRQIVQGYHGQEVRPLNLSLAGYTFVGAEILRPMVLMPSDQASVGTFAAVVGGDLLHFTVTVLVGSEISFKVRNLAVQVVEGALVRKQTEWGGMEPPSARKAAPAQGAGIPSHWNLDAEGHPSNPAVVEALSAYQRAPGVETARTLYRALCTAALILPEVGDTSGPVQVQAGVTSQPTSVRLRVLQGPNGEVALPAFTDARHLRAHYPEGTNFRVMDASTVAQMVLSQQTPLVLNPGPGGASMELPLKGLMALARGEIPELP